MKALIITSRGMESIASEEVNELVNAKSEIHKSCISSEVKSVEDLCKLAYLLQSCSRVLYLINSFSFKNKKDLFKQLKEKISKVDFDKWIYKEQSFKVSCSKESKLDISSEELAAEAGKYVIDKSPHKVDLENPDLTLYIYINEKDCYLGIDFSGFDLSKRDYKVFSHPASLKGTVAYSLVKLSGYDTNKTMLDVFSTSGAVPIEAALYASKFPVRYYVKDRFCFYRLKLFAKFDFNKFFQKIDKKADIKAKTRIFACDNLMRNLNAAKKNAKIAGIQKLIRFSRYDVEWLDTKFDKESIDCVASNVPSVSHHFSEKQAEKLYRELLYQLDYVLSKKGKAVLAFRSSELFEKLLDNKFKIEKKELWQGKQKFDVIIIKKN